ncbi:fatty acid synthase-like [Contarinia nasturtii]|uniref:fatty acid synthase-like n=1 Tax=Contarinia nasturtii TaxID=265458 RepID=UPI0012D4315F|nr:fatty acid synthase-like [Contarinia nasturtii]
MASERYSYKKLPDEIVITGMSGRLPESSTIEEFRDNLFNGVDMVNDEPRRWPAGLYDLPDRMGKIKDEDLENFDHQFFGVHQKQAECMDPQLRILLEATHEAIIDAGYNPHELRGSRTGVYIGVSHSETENYWLADPDRVNGYGLTGCARAMFANRLSFTFDFKGPSYACDTACSSSLYALSQAFSDLKAGNCSSAIVAGSGITLNPTMSLQLMRLNVLSTEGKCKAFDENGAGYVRSEGCVVIFVQLESQARRIYSTILNVRTNTDGFKEQGITFPDGSTQKQLIRETYNEIALNPHDVDYVEAHGTGTKVGDPQEVNAITDFFCKNRKTPLLIGSVKSNMGHSEAVSGVCSIVKVILAMEAKVIPGNLHYKSPNPDLYGILDGRVKVVDRNTAWSGGIVGLNSFGFGGANAHVILKSNKKRKFITSMDMDIVPRLIVVSGRTTEAVDLLLDEIEKNKFDIEFINLINEIHSKNIPLHLCRGYTIVGDIPTVRGVSELINDNHEIWYIYTGTGSQWASMAKDVMHLDVFRNSILQCADILRREGIDLMKILCKSDESTFDHIVNTFVSITAVQIALTDVLSHLGISPNGIIGHSIGELACAYADGCFTLEQTILAAYWRGRSLETVMEKGRMASIGLTWEETKARAPADIVAACHNGHESVTIAGPPELITRFIDDLIKEGVFAKVVNTSGYAFHSKYIASAGPIYKKSLEKIIPQPKNRTSRWLSTSIHEEDWPSTLAQQSSPAYHENNMLSPVFFHDAIQHIPKNAICIEISPTGLLQAILKRTLGSENIPLSLIKRGHKNNLVFFMQNIGKLYAAGVQPQISKLYAPISYPVGCGTPMLNSKIRWDHSQRFFVPKFEINSISGHSIIEINLKKDEDAYFSGHMIDGRLLFPATGYIHLVWRIFAKTKNSTFDKTSVVLEDIVFHRNITLPKEGSVKFNFSFLDSSGCFEICEGGSIVVSGKIYTPGDIEFEQSEPNLNRKLEGDELCLPLKIDDVYKELRLRGYDYNGKFRSISQLNMESLSGKLKWQDNWVSFSDTMVQINILGKDSRDLYLPTRIDRVVFNPNKHFEIITNLKENNAELPVYMYDGIIRSGGVELRGIKLSLAPRSDIQPSPILEHYEFVSLTNMNQELSQSTECARFHAISVATHLVIENSNGILKFKIVDVADNRRIENAIVLTIQRVIDSEPLVVSDLIIVQMRSTESDIQIAAERSISIKTKDLGTGPAELNSHLIIAYDVVFRMNVNEIFKHLKASIREDGFILLEENIDAYNKIEADNLFAIFNLTVISIQCASNKYLILLRQMIDITARNKTIISITEKNYAYLERLKSALATAERDNTYVYVIGQGEELLGAVGFMNCLKRENGGKFVRLIFVPDANDGQFSFASKMYADQMSKDLVINVYKNGCWGTYRHLKLNSQIGLENIQVEHAYVNTLNKGDLSSLSWIESPFTHQTPDPIDTRIELCTVYYAPVSLRDVMLSSGKMTMDNLNMHNNEDCGLGLEFSGRDSSGKRVMAIVKGKSLATTCIAQRNMIWEIPYDWTMEQASTIPCIYSSVYYALVVRGKMMKGESILIRAGSNLGLAAINVALHHGLIVYTTVDSEEEREFLKKTFPQLTDTNINRLRNISVEQFIMRSSKGKGVNLVLNSCADEIKASISCLCSNGRFLGIDTPNMRKASSSFLESIIKKNISFHGISLKNIMNEDDKTIERVVCLVADGIKNGAVHPLPTIVFSDKQLEHAFRLMDDTKLIGKTIIKIREEETQKSLNPVPKLISAIPKTYMHNEKSYIIAGGLGGFGLELANWMIERGATKLILTSRNGVKTNYQAWMMRRWNDRGVKVIIDTNDITMLDGVKNLLIAANRLGPIGGIFNLAAILHDDLFENQTEANFKAVCEPKIDATKHFDTISRELCPALDYFVCFSSVTSGRGIIGQTNYGLANSAMERICENRKASGFPGTAIQWGAIGDTGLVIDNLGDNNTVINGTLPQRMVSCLKTIDHFMQQPHAVLVSMVMAEKYTAKRSDNDLVSCIANILGLKDLNNVSNQTSLADLNLDSLMSVEIKQTLERNYDIRMGVPDIRQLTVEKIRKLENSIPVVSNYQQKTHKKRSD